MEIFLGANNDSGEFTEPYGRKRTCLSRLSKRRSLCASKVQKRWEKSHVPFDSHSTISPEHSGAMHAENSISTEGSHAGEKEQHFNASANKFQMFLSVPTSTFSDSE
ncbi:hypothetical protein TNCT_474031 [Trichonephila clavata]|uniref:Uncharacterized protein n=1 Tax=Trichonephila clavata TaxID=2740835 RepID=A0A8X6L2Z1_TRICU|nr:hypothetical protein TNCT_474031 [Trichonephila clavata]